METGKIKKFAVEARNVLKRGIEAKITTLGFDAKGNVAEANKPRLVQGGCLWNGSIHTEGFYHQWLALYRRVQEKGIREVYEEAAYTWFNRLMAIRILQKNQLCEPVLDYADAARTPRIVDEARMGRMPQMGEDDRARLTVLLDNDTKTTEQFALLVTAFCHQSPIISSCFGRMQDYTELLLPHNILAEGGLVDMINHTEFITDDDFRSSELIGWLYQFYISERKDEVFAKKGKFEADEIPAATQIFTPNWIVKYMVQNTVGRIYLDNNPWDADELKARWKYLVDQSEPTSDANKYVIKELEDLRVADLSCGSGHILNECFDLLYDLYIREGYSRADAITNIFQRNLTGVDIDTRAKQLATFALLLKACQRDASFADAHCLPNVIDMPNVDVYTWNDTGGHLMCNMPVGRQTTETEGREIREAFTLMQNADSLGSIMKFSLSDSTREFMQACVDEYTRAPQHEDAFGPIIHAFRVMLALTTNYSALVMNPPYMGSGNMNKTLSEYVKTYYEEGKADLCTVFMVMQRRRTARNGYYANIIPPSWMFLSSFEKLRKSIIEQNAISSLLHLSRGVFGADFGSVSCVIQNTRNNSAKGTYFRLIERTFQEFDQKHLQLLFEKTLANHDFRYFFGDYTKDVEDIVYSENGAKIYYPNVSQQNFEKIPGCPIGYWVSEKMRDVFAKEQSINSVAKPRQGLATSDNNRFLKFWHEVAVSNIGFNYSRRHAINSGLKWFPCSKGGTFRRWYGNMYYVVNWQNDGEEICDYAATLYKNATRTIKNIQFYFDFEGATWSTISSGKVSFRFFPKGCLFETKGSVCIPNEGISNNSLMGYLNSPLVNAFLEAISPTMDYHEGPIGRLPYKEIQSEPIDHLVVQNIAISKQDWDAHETSWDFAQNELVALNNSDAYTDVMDENAGQNGIYVDITMPKFGDLEWLMGLYKQKWETKFEQLHENEEELNRQFIDIYGLQDELTPDVPMNEITILQQGEIFFIPAPGDSSGVCNTIIWRNDEIIKQLISYAVGVWMGRYRLDRKGLAIAHPQPTAEELAPYDYNGETVRIDDDAIIPILPAGSPFDDNLPHRIADFVRIAFGEENLTQNLNYMEQCLGETIEQYCLKDFWGYHKKMYQNRPIYWLFSSKKGAFKAIAYMHRMNAYTAEQVRAKYLLPYIDFTQQQVSDLDARAAELSTKERKQLDGLRKQLDELREYHDRLQVVAEDTERTQFDLDDGVVVNYAKYGDVLAKLK